MSGLRKFLVGFILITAALSSAAPQDSAWKTLPPLPDPIGFGGMFAGNADGTLFAGGGSHFDKPVWKGGKKSYSDRVFLLKTPEGPWETLPQKLPREISNSASAPFGQDVISVGGMGSDGAFADAYRIGLRDGSLHIETLPPFPHPLVYAAAAIVQDVIYVIGGVSDAASTTPGNECWTLSLAAEKRAWKKVIDFPGKPGIVMSAASDGRFLYVFGGMHYQTDGGGKSLPVPLDGTYRFDPAANTWTQLENLPFARVGAATPSPVLPDGRILVAGGYAAVFPGAQKNHSGFERETLIYSPAKNSWQEGPMLPCERKIDPETPASPGPEPMVTAPAVVWHDHIVLISAVVGIPFSALP
jgi:N-acetylneuraminate epimerase